MDAFCNMVALVEFPIPCIPDPPPIVHAVQWFPPLAVQLELNPLLNELAVPSQPARAPGRINIPFAFVVKMTVV